MSKPGASKEQEDIKHEEKGGYDKNRPPWAEHLSGIWPSMAIRHISQRALRKTRTPIRSAKLAVALVWAAAHRINNAGSAHPAAEKRGHLEELTSQLANEGPWLVTAGLVYAWLGYKEQVFWPSSVTGPHPPRASLSHSIPQTASERLHPINAGAAGARVLYPPVLMQEQELIPGYSTSNGGPEQYSAVVIVTCPSAGA
ncbi:hypothetical protein H113_01456 [Trichophyton rubrum MR1459]|nr:hypothetical protein H113_01456 [Trichophyton rubrum MR1459]